MGCGHSKINIYSRKSKSKTNSKKSVTAEKVESEEEQSIEPEAENSEDLEDCERKTIKFKSFGGPLLAQSEISTSQQDFFKMLDDKIQSGPDYNSESESEKAQEMARLKALLKDWETASAGSRSLPATPKKRPAVPGVRGEGVRSANVTARPEGGVRDAPLPPRAPERVYVSQIPQSVIHQSYGVAQPQYRQVTYNPNYLSQSPSHQMTYPSAMQYQAISPMYSNQPTYQPSVIRQYSNYNQIANPIPNTSYSQHTSQIKGYVNNSPSHIPYDQPVSYSSSQMLYGMPMAVPQQSVVNEPTTDIGCMPAYSNGELHQQHLYSQHTMQYQQYKEAREQILAQNQQQPVSVVYRGSSRNYQSSVTMPIASKGGQQSDMNMLHRKQYELT